MADGFAYRVNDSAYFVAGSAYQQWELVADFEGVAAGDNPPGWFSTEAQDWAVQTSDPVYQGSRVYRFDAGGGGSNSTAYIDDSGYSPLPERGDTLGGHVHLGVGQNRAGIMYGVERGRGQAYPEHYAVLVDGQDAEVTLEYDNLSQSAETIHSEPIDTTGIASAWIRIQVGYGDPTHSVRATLLGDDPRELASFEADHGSGQMLENDTSVGFRGVRRVESDVVGAELSFDQFYMV